MVVLVRPREDADVDGVVAGHVAAVPGFENDAVSQAMGRSHHQILGVTRLYVAPQGRGHGAADVLLDAVEKDVAAIALYEKRGWHFAGPSPRFVTLRGVFAAEMPRNVTRLVLPRLRGTDVGAGGVKSSTSSTAPLDLD